MTRKKWIFALDASLLAGMLLALSPHLAPLPVHEWLGLAVCVPILLHLLLSWSWIRHATRQVVRPGWRTRANYMINFVLFVLVVLIVWSGLVISRAVTPLAGVRLPEDWSWRSLHNGSANALLFLIALHLAMNWTWIRTTVRRLGSRTAALPRRARPGWAAAALRRSGVFTAAAAAVAGVSYAFLGAPALRRRFPFDELRIYATPRVHMAGRKVLMEVAVIGVLALISRVVLRVRLEPRPAGRRAQDRGHEAYQGETGEAAD